jgi:branched-chain amino acid transport system substrate-binding protein
MKIRSQVLIGVAILAILIVVVGILYTGSSQSPKKLNEIVVGAALPLTGNSAVWGVPTKEGVELAVDEINKSGGIKGLPVRVVYEDTTGDPKVALSAVEKLLSADNVLAIIDDSNSSVTLAIGPVLDRNKTVLLVTGASSPKIAKLSPYKFRIWNSDSLEGQLMATYLQKKKSISRVAVLYVNNNYGQGLKDVFVAAFGANGITDQESFTEDASDFRAQIAKILASNADAIYIIAYPKQGALLLKQLQELGNRKKLFGAVAFEDTGMLSNAGSSAENLEYPLPAPVDPKDTAYKAFVSAYKVKFHKDIPFLADVGFDGMNVIAAAFSQAKAITREDLRESLSTLPLYQGVSGPIKFDTDGEVHKPFGIRVVKNGKAEWLIRDLNLQ